MKNNKKPLIIVSILIILMICAAFTSRSFQNDTFYTIKVGESIVKNGIDMKDHFSIHKLAYTYPHWLYDVMTYKLYTAGGLQGSIFSGVNNRYFDTYTSSPASARAGDALGSSTTTNPGAAGWHSASRSYWVGSSYPYFLRGSGGIFSFDRGSSDGYYGRGVVVCGAGL